jgi:hypothetical protein
MKTIIGGMTCPVPFAGTSEELEANFKSHDFWGFETGTTCMQCDCKPWHMTAKYPCGSDVPRHTVTEWSDGTVTTVPD